MTYQKLSKYHNTCTEDAHHPGDNLYGDSCHKCGNIAAYADDTVYTTSDKKRDNNQVRKTEILNRITSYLNNNRMTINQDKTTIWEFMLKQKACKVRGIPPSLTTTDSKGDIKIIETS